MQHRLGKMPGIDDLVSLINPPTAEGSIFPAANEDTTTSHSTSAGFSNMPELCFQYWPESLQDDKDIGWEFYKVPGGSHSLARWNSGGERTISFECVFTRDVDYAFSVLDIATNNVPEAQYLDPSNNPDLRAVQKWLRWYTYPVYSADGIPKPPPRLHLVFPGTQLSWDGMDDILCVMKSCDFEILDWFSSGVPRMMKAKLEFSEVVQDSSLSGIVRFHGRNDPIASTAQEDRRGSPDAAKGPGDYLRKPRQTFVLNRNVRVGQQDPTINTTLNGIAKLLKR
jgi:hypothetical protein